VIRAPRSSIEWGERREGVEDLREGLTDGIDEEGRPESERGGRLRGYRGGQLVASGYCS
jgi:hypothetical protein